MKALNARALCLASAIAALTTISGTYSYGANLDLSDTPLFLSAGVEPNLIMAIDDSGSMDFEVLLRGNDGSAWWRTDTASDDCTAVTGRSFVGCISNGSRDIPAAGQLNFNNDGDANGTWKKYSYLFPNGSDSAVTSYQRRSGDSTNDHFAIPPLPAYAWARSPIYNTAYFNPANTYKPWPNGGGFTFTDSTPTAARFDPVFGTAANAINLTREVAGTASANVGASCDSTLPGVAGNYYFRVFAGMKIPVGACIRTSENNSSWQQIRTQDCQIGVNNGCLTTHSTAGNLTRTIGTNSSVAIKYFPATFFLPSTTSLPTGFGYTGSTTAITGQAPDGSTLIGYEIKPGNFASTEQYNAAIQNFANWFTYSRKRHLALRAGLGEAFSDITGMRVAGFTINNNGADVTMGSIDDASHRSDLYGDFYRDFVRTGGTPNRAAVSNIVRNLKRTGAGAPIQYACQKNFGMLFTDGFSNTPAAGDGFFSLGNIDGTAGAPYADDQSGTLADGVMDAYMTRLRATTDFPAGQVRVPAGCGGASSDPTLDCNADLHMNFYAVTLGTRGLLFNPDADPPQNPYATPTPVWPTSFPARHPSAVDDIWHATINGRGQLLNARTPDEISDKLEAVLTSIIESSGSASSAAVNSGSISSETRLYQAKFDSADWTGQLYSYPVNADGSLQTTGSGVWEASTKLPVHGARTIITVNSDGAAVPFTWNSLDATRRVQIHPNYADSAAEETQAERRLDYLRGDGSNEAPAGLGLRTRPSKLGDIVSSSPMFVGSPRFSYSDSLEADAYSEFKRLNSDDPATTNTVEGRDHVVYAGANDGMLHAFDARTGTELLAFVPSPAFKNLRSLTDPAYAHKFFVDGAPNMGDAFINNDWQTVLVGGLNRGGQGIYALNITDPDDFSAANADDIVLWEFTDADDPDLGYTYSQPAIVRLHNGRWAAIFGNGYNNTENDGAATTSTTGNAVLFIVDLESGAVIRKLDTGVGSADDPGSLSRPNGMSTPAAVDINGDSKVDFVFAGDLFGNMWKLDLRSTDEDDWDFSFSDANGPLPLFAAVDPARADIRQPITARPEVIRGPRGVGMMVLFGTGKYIEDSDNVVSAADTRIQSYYGLFDRNAYTNGAQASSNRITSATELTQQSILDEVSVTMGSTTHHVRLTSQLPLGANKGWYLKLLSPDGYQGERQVSNTTVRAGRVIFTTLIPNDDPCQSGGSSWLMELDALSGGRLTETPFDLNGDGEFTDADFVVAPDGTRVPVSGLQPGVGITPEPGILIGDNGRKEFKYNPGTTGEIAVTVENPGKHASGRQSWRQIR